MKYFALLAAGPILTTGLALADAPGMAAATPAAVPASGHPAPAANALPAASAAPAANALPAASAAPGAAPSRAAPAKLVAPGRLSCEEFLMYDEITRPQIIYWSLGSAHKGRAGGEIIDVARTNTLVPILVDDCRREPKTSFWHEFKSEFKKGATR
jgi:hypothetical protein